MAFDHASGRVLLFGGADSGSSSSRLGDTWVWDGVNWQQLFPASSPSPRATHAMASDPLRQRIVLFSGTSLNDTWEWNGSAWLSRMPATSPPFRGNAGMAYDADRQRIVLCGGSWSSYLDDTWEWDGTDWLQMPTATTFGGRAFHGVAYHTAIRRMLLFGGPYGYHDTWIYGDLVASTVQTLGPGCPGSAGLPRLALSDPYVGNPEFALDLLDVPPSAGCAFGLDTVTQSLPIGGGCTVWLWNPALYFVVARASGCASFRLAIPLDPGLRGAVFHAQAAVFDPLGPAAGIALSAARTFVLGD
jgi:hypothetical protein